MIPGLYEAFIPRGIAIFDSGSVLIPMHPVGPNAGKPSMVVQVSRRPGAGIIRMYQIYTGDGTPFTGNVKGLTISPQHVWTTDDTYDPYADLQRAAPVPSEPVAGEYLTVSCVSPP